MNDVSWIRLKYDVQPPVFRCGHCEDIHVLELPMGLLEVADVADAFTKRHTTCPEPKPTEPR